MPKSTKTPVAALKSFMGEYQITTNKLAKEIKLSHTAVAKIVAGTGRISPSTALRLAKFFATSPEYWFDLQTKLDLAEAAADAKLAALLKTINRAAKPAPVKALPSGKVPAKKAAGTARGAAKKPAKGTSRS
ncbi:MAG: HigA family addiction module antidote protein [Treponema sp.]|jgi:addiction module HigA family antidote|nr:HigA family addiction module antidote protein [Treponema sp.]